jgi:Zn-dependent M28 family amino/carboxypeptidase
VVGDDAFPKRKAALEAGITMLASDPTHIVRGIITESAAKRVVETSVPLRADTKVSTEIAEFTSHNVAGALEGARQPDEYVLYTAHWDSFGHCRPGEADEICNGAIDNASGTAGLIELARAFASGPRPDRSILFLATTAEEMGLAGSRQYARTPLVPLARTVAEFNLDVIVLYDRGNTAGFVGAGLTDADSVFGRLVAAQGRTLETGQLTRMVVRSSDAWSLLMAGVPSFILSGAIGNGAQGSKAFHDYLATRYHQPSDEFDASMPMGGAVEEVELLYAAGLYYATMDTNIRFKPESAFQRKD